MKSSVLICGGSGGIGEAIARILHARGYALHLTGRNEERLAGLSAELGATFTPGDVGDTDFFARWEKDAGEALDGLVYAVGTINLRSLARLTADDFLRDFRANALGAALVVQAALPALKRSPGVASVVLFSSVAAGQGFPLHASIGMAKGAVSGLPPSVHHFACR